MNKDKELRTEWLEKLDTAIDLSLNEELPESFFDPLPEEELQAWGL